MKYTHRETRFALGLLLAGLFFAAQMAAALHAFEHDLGTRQGTVCSTCLTVAHLGAATIDCSSSEPLQQQSFIFVIYDSTGFSDTRSLVPRQRGPPSATPGYFL